MSSNAITIDHVTKRFRVHTERHSTLKEKVLFAGRSRYREFTALEDVSLTVPRGSTVGLLGVNGSGKSTLLKLVSRILYPDAGTIRVDGRVSSLLELGAGFHLDFTGRENIFLNGSLLGLTKRDIRSKIDTIVDFSELGDFIDEPVRSYSSGMYMRLAFSIAVAIEPEILLIDEILAVGDSAFQQKCIDRIRGLQGDGKTIMIVSHDLGKIAELCDHAVWIDKASVRTEGDPTVCIPEYLEQTTMATHTHDRAMRFSHD